VEYILELFLKVNKNEPADFILLTGDLIAHGIAQDAPSKDILQPESDPFYDILLNTHTLM
jgi:hypothetical protein